MVRNRSYWFLIGLAGVLVALALGMALRPVFTHATLPLSPLVSINLRSSAQAAPSSCPALPSPDGRVVNVSSETELWNAVNEDVPDTTILVADGTYHLGQNGYYLWFDTPRVTLRSASGNREAVILDDNYSGAEIISIVASDVTIAELTIKRAGTHPIHVMSSDSGDTLNTRIYGVHIIDPGQQAVKINPHSAQVYFPDQGEIACSQIELTDAGRPIVWEINGSCYTGGIDAHQARGWVIRDNLIEGFWCDSGLSEHGIHLWRGCRDTLVERNELRDNARGIGFGLMQSGDARTYPDNPCPSAGGGYVGHYGGIIRNNFLFAGRSALFASEYGFDCGVCLAQACEAQVLHNTVVSTQAPGSSIEWRFANTSGEIINNLVSHNLWEREGEPDVFLDGNLSDAPLSLFVDGPGGDLHLVASASAAIDQGVAIAGGLCDDDFDGDVRPVGAARDIGGDEYSTRPPAAVTDLRVTHGITETGVLHAALRWTAPSGAATTTLRYSDTLITEHNWALAPLLTDALSGSLGSFTATVPYENSLIFFALKTRNAAGGWSDLSNNAFWPAVGIWLPSVLR